MYTVLAGTLKQLSRAAYMISLEIKSKVMLV